ncbi:MAG: enoyl-CoA hydratase-related protein, partial [Gemmatimonadota bacterium]
PGGFAGLTELWDLDKPVIAAINGVAVGGGFELALACDLIVAVEAATFSLPETSIGVAADAGGIQRLPRRIPRNIALDMLLTGRKMDAAEAARWGLVNYVVDREDLRPKVYELADAIVGGAPLSVRAIKEILRGTDGMSEREAFEAVNRRDFPTHERMLRSEDHEEGPRAFVEKRKPKWRGR